MCQKIMTALYPRLTPWSRVLLEKPFGSQLVKFPTFNGTQMFITAFKSAHRLSQSWGILIQSMPSHPTSWRFIFVLSSHLLPGSSKWFLSLRFPDQNPEYTSVLTHTCYMPQPPHSLFDHPNNIGLGVQFMKLLIM